jgi:ABC-type glycerol-3-phosphate transport system permease component
MTTDAPLAAPAPLPAAAPPPAARPRARHLHRVAWHAVMVAVSAGCLAPLLWMAVTSLRDPGSALTGPILPHHLTWNAYSYAWNGLKIWRNFINSVVITGCTILITVLCTTLAGYAFARIRFAGRSVVFSIIVSALFLPSVATLIPVYLELVGFGLLGTETGLVLVYAAGGIPFSAYLMRTFFEAVPGELSEAARIDGASELQIFRKVMLPLAAPAVATVVIFQMIGVWNELLFASALIFEPSDQPIQPAANALIGQYSTNWPVLTAGMTLSAIPMVLAYVVFQRWFVAGLTAGAVKS